MLSLRVDFLFRSYSPRIQTQVHILVGNPQFEIRKTWISVQTPLVNISVILGNLHSSVSESLNLFVCKIETVIMLPTRASLVAQMVKNLPAVQETWIWSLGQEDPLEKLDGNQLQYSWLEISMDRGAWWAGVHGVAMSYTWLSDQPFGFVCVCMCA